MSIESELAFLSCEKQRLSDLLSDMVHASGELVRRIELQYKIVTGDADYIAFVDTLNAVTAELKKPPVTEEPCD